MIGRMIAAGVLIAGCAADITGGAAVAASQAQSTQARSTRAQSGRECFRPDNVNGFHPVDDQTVDVNVGPSRVFRLSLQGNCQDINWSESIGIRSRGGGWVCNPIDAELIVPSVIGPNTCQITAMHLLTPAELEASRHRGH